MPPTVDATEERQLLEAVKLATDYINAGDLPDAAVEKIARDQGFGPGKIRLVGQAINNGRQLGQWRTPSTGILDKIASFDLCDPEAVIAKIYGGPTQAEKDAAETVHAEYRRPPSWADTPARQKAASYKLPAGPKPEPYAPSPGAALDQAINNVQRAKLASDEARRQASAARDEVLSRVADVVAYFKQASYNRLPFESVEAAATSYYGDPAKTLLNVAYSGARLREKRAADTPTVLTRPIDLKTAPFTLIKAAIDAAGRCNYLSGVAVECAQRHATAQVEELRPFAKAGEAQQPATTGPWSEKAAAVFGFEKKAFGFGTEVAAIAAGDILAHKATHQQTNSDPYGDVESLDDELSAIQQLAARKRRGATGEKRAFMGMGLGAALGGVFGRSMGTIPQPKSDMVESEWLKLEDPEHENELRKIKAHALLNQLMTDPDEPIAGHEPDRVMAAYNEISSATPRLAENLATLRPALRKRLEGHQEPFETKELLDIEQGLAKSRAPTPTTNILRNAPESVMG